MSMPPHAMLPSVALQYGVPIDVIRGALLRNPNGSACTPLAAALDELAKKKRR
jgi:hypothetical protein